MRNVKSGFDVFCRCVGVSKNLFPGVWRCDSRLATPDDSLFCKVEENLSGSVFPSRQTLQVTEM